MKGHEYVVMVRVTISYLCLLLHSVGKKTHFHFKLNPFAKAPPEREGDLTGMFQCRNKDRMPTAGFLGEYAREYWKRIFSSIDFNNIWWVGL